MRLWERHQVLATKAKREGRTVHRHRWNRMATTNFGVEFRCDGCPQRVTERQMMAAGPGQVMALFEPYAEPPEPVRFVLGGLF